MAFDPQLTAEVADLIAREAHLLDRRAWEDWLSLYAEDAVFWAPAFADDETFTSDPDTEISLMYMDRRGLEARVFRIESGDSYATEPPPWTSHLVTNIVVTGVQGDLIEASANWLVYSFSRARGKTVRGGHYDYGLRRDGEGLTIVQKKILIFDDAIEGPLDIYNV